MSNSTNEHNEYSGKDRVEFGLMAVFPTLEAYGRFIEEDKGDIRPFIRLARKYGIIPHNKAGEAFEAFIEEHSRDPEERTPPAGLTLSELLENKEKIKLSVRGLTGWINELMNEFDLNHLMPAGKVSNAMFSRLGRGPANTPAKRNTLRLLSFWFGYKRPQLGPVWNYETLLKLCPSEQKLESDEGARIAFYLRSRGDLIEDKTVKWLKNELGSCVKDLGYVQYGKIHSYSTTSFYLDLPNAGIAKHGMSHLGAYSRCVRDAIAIAHQLSIRWALSPLSSQRRIMTIGIAAGIFSTLDVYLQTILNAKLPGDPVIRMTDYARQCVLVNDIRIIFCQTPKEIEIFDGEIVNIWWVTELWNTYYWDFIPALLKDEILQSGPEADEKLGNLLWLTSEDKKLQKSEMETNAITTFLKSPQNSLMGLEIAKTLYYRRKFLEANEILRVILSTEPSSLTARTLRMMIFRDLGLDESLPYSVSEAHFRRAEEEAAFIEENCSNKHEDYYCEFAYVKIGKALRILQLIKENGGTYEDRDKKIDKQDVYKLLYVAENIIMKGVTVSSTGHRAVYMIGCVLSLIRLLKKDTRFCQKPQIQLLDNDNICIETVGGLLLALGLLRRDHLGDVRHEFLHERIISSFMLYEDAVPLRTRQPNLKFAHAAALWDFSPIITAGIAKMVLKLLIEAREMATRLNADKVCVASVTRIRAEITPVDGFVRDIQEVIKQVEARVGKLEDLEEEEDAVPISVDKLGGLKLFCLNL